MARPEIPQEHYIEALEKMLADGMRMDDIKPVKLQQAVGGRYNKCAEILESYRSQHQAQSEQAQQAPQPAWFKEVVTTASESVKRSIEGTWFTLHSEMNKAIDLAAEGYDKKKAELQTLRNEDRKQIDVLEAKVDELTESLVEKSTESGRLKESLNMAQASAREAQAVTEERKQRIQTLESENEGEREQTAKAEKQIEHLTTENEALKRELEKQKDEYKHQFKKFTETGQTLQDLRIDNARIQDRYDNAEKRVSELSGQVKEFQEKLFKLAEEGQKVKQQNKPSSS